MHIFLRRGPIAFNKFAKGYMTLNQGHAVRMEKSNSMEERIRFTGRHDRWDSHLRPKARLLAWAMIGKLVYLLPRILVKAQFWDTG